MKYVLAPGPWTVDAVSVGQSWTDSLPISDAADGWVCILTRGYECGPSWANAHLIAAAPELLEATKALLAVIVQRYPYFALTEAYIQARAAIAKATNKDGGK